VRKAVPTRGGRRGVRAKVQCLHARECCVASSAHATDFHGVMHKGCRLWWCPDCGALNVNRGTWLEPKSAMVERQVRELRRRVWGEARDAG